MDGFICGNAILAQTSFGSSPQQQGKSKVSQIHRTAGMWELVSLNKKYNRTVITKIIASYNFCNQFSICFEDYI